MKELVNFINESVNQNVSTIKAENRYEWFLNETVNSYEDAVEVFAKYFGVKNYKITNCENKDKSFKQGPKYYTRDGYMVNKYVQFLIGKRDPKNVRFTISQHGNNLVIQLIYYKNNRVDDYSWAYGLYDKNKYKYGKEKLSDWLKGIDEAKLSADNYHSYIKF